MKKIISLLYVSLTLTILLSITIYATQIHTNDDILPVTNELYTKESIGIQKYNDLLEYWAYDPDYVHDINADFPSYYGGAYLDDEKNLIIQVTELNENIINEISSIIDLSNVVFEKVNYSFEDLKQAKQNILDQIRTQTPEARSIESQIAGVGISFSKNSVNLYLYSQTENDLYSLSEKSLVNYVTDFENINIIYTDEPDEPCATAVRPGSEIRNYTSSTTYGRRSVGYWAEDSSGNTGIVTAPHDSISEGDTISIGSSTFGVAETPYYSGSVDAVFVRCTNSDFIESRTVMGHGFDLISRHYINLIEGSTTYSYGISNAAETGTVQDISYDTAYGISDCVVTSAPCSSGDSGGIVAGGGDSEERYVAGIITGKQGDTSYVMYVKAANINSTLGVTVY